MPMVRQDTKRGRPPGVKHGEFVGLRIPESLSLQIDAYIAAQPEPRPSRSEAIRQLLAVGLGRADNDAAQELSVSDRWSRAIFEARQIRDGEKAEPGIVQRARMFLDE
jgi:hypothetical protein